MIERLCWLLGGHHWINGSYGAPGGMFFCRTCGHGNVVFSWTQMKQGAPHRWSH